MHQPNSIPVLTLLTLTLLSVLAIACEGRSWWTGLEHTPAYHNCHSYITKHLHPDKSNLAEWPCLKLASGRDLTEKEREDLVGYHIQNEAGTNDERGQFNRRLLDNDFPQLKVDTETNTVPDP